jgi:hypothetical protein
VYCCTAIAVHCLRMHLFAIVSRRLALGPHPLICTLFKMAKLSPFFHLSRLACLGLGSRVLCLRAWSWVFWSWGFWSWVLVLGLGLGSWSWGLVVGLGPFTLLPLVSCFGLGSWILVLGLGLGSWSWVLGLGLGCGWVSIWCWSWVLASGVGLGLGSCSWSWVLVLL